MSELGTVDHKNNTLPDKSRHIVITGASGEIGGALALAYAGPGVLLTLCGRKENKLVLVKKYCEAKGATVELKIIDLRETEELRLWARNLSEDENFPIDLLIVNAGLNTNIGLDLKGEPFEESKALVEVNLLSDIALIDAVLPAMRKRKLRSYGNSLRAWLKPEGIKINVILPGYVDSPMCRAMPGPKPFLMKPEKAAKIIKKGLEKNRARISFPFPLNLGIWSLSLLPHCVAAPIAALFGYGIMKK